MNTSARPNLTGILILKNKCMVSIKSSFKAYIEHYIELIEF